MANAFRPFHPSLGGGSRADRDESRAGSEDAAGGVATEISGYVRRWSGADATAASEAMAGDGWTRTGGVFRAAARGRKTGTVRLHPYERTGHHDRRAEFSTHAVPLRADVFQLGSRLAVLLGEL